MMKNKILQWTVVVFTTIATAAIELGILLSLHPARYYFTLRGFGIAGLVEIAMVALLAPVAITLVHKDHVLRNWLKPIMNQKES